MVYKLSDNINLNDIALPAYDDVIQSTFTSADTTDPKAIYMSDYNYSALAGSYEAYGVFPYFSGTLSYINFVLDNNGSAVAIEDTDTTTKAIGSAIGYAEAATIDNVNVYANIKVNNAIGRYFIGGIAGVIGDKTTISNSTLSSLKLIELC